MATPEKCSDIFSILHDGCISGWIGDKSFLTLEIECLYLAERINPSFSRFYVEIIQINSIYLAAWWLIPKPPLTDLRDIFQAELEILSASIQGDEVIITCNQHGDSVDYAGGNLALSCQDIRIYDQNKNELTIDRLDKVCNEYWDEWAGK